MGTRHLVAVHIDGEYKVGQYGQWDGYPSGQGVALLDFLRSGNIEGLKRNLARTFEPNEDDEKRMWAEFGVDIVATNGSVPYEVARAHGERYPSLSRDTGAEILQLIADWASEERIPLVADISFAGDSLFCEWAYVIDFDIGTFEVYRGFNKEGPVPEGSRFHDIPWDDNRLHGIGPYYQVTLSRSWNLEDLPSQEAFLDAFKAPAKAEDTSSVPATAE
ncbi:hypothetical protein G6L37_04600 [Agrobacterium rubi]|nr:hypothetical protein [Agrobacterium rubi]NTF24633.1 hypothetical protein [Agrobacterium rubi]